MNITRNEFKTDFILIKDDGSGVRIDLCVDPTVTECETYYKIINIKKIGCHRFSYAYNIDRATFLYNDEVEQNTKAGE